MKGYLLIVDDKDAKWSIFEYSTIKNFLPVTHLQTIVDFLKEGLEGFYNFFTLSKSCDVAGHSDESLYELLL